MTVTSIAQHSYSPQAHYQQWPWQRLSQAIRHILFRPAIHELKPTAGNPVTNKMTHSIYSSLVACGVFVHLRLALFPAGGPFLPSLSVNLF
jgi:hypothetical protein